MASARETFQRALHAATGRSSPRDITDRRDIRTYGLNNEERPRRAPEEAEAAEVDDRDSCAAVLTRGGTFRAKPLARKVTTSHKVRALRKLIAALDNDVQQLEAKAA